MIDQVMKSSSYRDPKMKAYCEEVRRLEDKFHGLELNHVARRYNEATDELAKIASSQTIVPPDVFARDLHQPSVNIRADGGADGPSLDPPPEAKAPSTGAEAMQAEGSPPPANLEPDWRVSYLDHLTRGDLPSDKTEARRSTRWAKSFVIFGDNKELYRHSPTGILQRCIINKEGKNLLKDLHSGLAVITRHLEPSLETHSDKVFTGQPQSLTLSS
jgi:hypothetical protein